MAHCTIDVNFQNRIKPFKPVNSVNNGPVYTERLEQNTNNFLLYKALKLPYARTHDASFCASYGGEHIVDVHAIFPDFSKDENEPVNYDFDLTDDYVKAVNMAGTKVFFRLGSKIEHTRKKYGTKMPTDFAKWARICEHIVLHYTQGWANGFAYDIEYWEIWNEADGATANGDKPNWSGTDEEYFEFYKVSATYLKSKFPHLKIGGPALSWLGNEEFRNKFLAMLKNSNGAIPMDFFSWHMYSRNPIRIYNEAQKCRELIDAVGYTQSEIIINEWNIILGWGTGAYELGMEYRLCEKGASYVAAGIMLAQRSPLDMLMYYDMRPCCSFDGVFAPYTLKPLKTYYVYKCIGDMFELGTEAESVSTDDEVYCLAGSNGEQNALLVSYYPLQPEYPEEAHAKAKVIKINPNGFVGKKATLTVIDKNNDEKTTVITVGKILSLKLLPYSVAYLKTK